MGFSSGWDSGVYYFQSQGSDEGSYAVDFRTPDRVNHISDLLVELSTSFYNLSVSPGKNQLLGKATGFGAPDATGTRFHIL
jgi:hypothetical protein